MNRQLKAILAVAVIILSAWWIWRQSAGPSVQTDLTVYTGIGEVTAEQTLKAINNKGQVAVFVFKGTDDNNPPMKTILKSFNSAIGKASGVHVAPLEKLTMGGGAEGGAAGQELSAGRHLRASCCRPAPGRPWLGASSGRRSTAPG